MLSCPQLPSLHAWLHGLGNELSIDACHGTPASVGILVFLLILCFATYGLKEDDRAELAADEMCSAEVCTPPLQHALASHVRSKCRGALEGATWLKTEGK